MKRALVPSLLAATIGALACAVPAQAAAPSFRNCTAMHERYEHGVGRKGATDRVRGATKPVTTFLVSTAIYQANSRLDRDRDGVACEQR